jgi:hypothetical protein
MKKIKREKNNFKSLIILLVVLIFGIVLLQAIQKKWDTRSSAAGITYAKCSYTDLAGTVLSGTCNASSETGSCVTSTGYSGVVIKGYCSGTSLCCIPDTGKIKGAESCVAVGGGCIRAYGYPKDGAACTFGGKSGVYASGLCTGTYGAVDYKCCKPAPTSIPTSTPKPSCAAKGGACVKNVTTCTVTNRGSVVSGTTCSGTTPICCRLAF